MVALGLSPSNSLARLDSSGRVESTPTGQRPPTVHAADDEYEEDRELTPDEKIEELKVLLSTGKIGIHAYDKHFTMAWSKVLQSEGRTSPAMARQASRKFSAAKDAVGLSQEIDKRSRASRKSKEMYQDQVLSGGVDSAPRAED